MDMDELKALGDVAPFVGAWIEIQAENPSMTDWPSRTLRGCVD